MRMYTREPSAVSEPSLLVIETNGGAYVLPVTLLFVRVHLCVAVHAMPTTRHEVWLATLLERQETVRFCSLPHGATLFVSVAYLPELNGSFL